MKFVNWLVENWSLIIAVIAIVTCVVIVIIKFAQLTPEQQKAKIKKCLLGWVIEAEKDLGSKTGQVKLSVVYGYFVTAFPIVKNFITLETFSGWVDEALDTMRTMLENNAALKQYIEGYTLEAATDTIKES